MYINLLSIVLSPKIAENKKLIIYKMLRENKSLYQLGLGYLVPSLLNSKAFKYCICLLLVCLSVAVNVGMLE